MSNVIYWINICRIRPQMMTEDKNRVKDMIGKDVLGKKRALIKRN